MVEIRVLLVEDNVDQIKVCQRYLNQLSSNEGVSFHVDVATSLSTAIVFLESNAPLDLVILDLGLPMLDGGPDCDSHANGRLLFERFSEREHRPIPALVVMSGFLGQIEMHKFQTMADSRFAYGSIANKLDVKGELIRAIQYIDRYRAVRLLPSDGHPLPRLTPRDEDLVKRCIVAIDGKAATLRDWGNGTTLSLAVTGSTRVLFGTCELSRGPSHPVFVKLVDEPFFTTELRAASLFSKIVPSYSVLQSAASACRGVIMSPKAGMSNSDTVSLLQSLAREDVSESDAIALADDVVAQLDKMGYAKHVMKPLSSFFWTHLKSERIGLAWGRRPASFTSFSVLPERLLPRLRGSADSIEVVERGYTHCDLHADNVACDCGSRWSALIIDPGSMSPGPWGKDLAQLEVSLLLHQKSQPAGGIVEAVQSQSRCRSSAANNTRAFLDRTRCLRRSSCSDEAYHFMLLDSVLAQLDALADQVLPRIQRPDDVYRLYTIIVEWLVQNSALFNRLRTLE